MRMVGPYTYDDKILPATLTRFDKIDSLRYDAVFVIEDTSSMEWQDSLRYSKLNHNYYFSADQVAGDSLVVGKKYQYITRSIRPGTAIPISN